MEAFDLFEKTVIKNFPLYPSKSDPYRNVIDSVLCGAVAGIAAKTVIAPAERIKMSFQVSTKKYTLRNAMNEGSQIIKKEGFLSLWKGHSTTILRVAPYSGFSYAFHDLAENVFKQMLHSDVLPSSYKFLAGSLGGVFGTILTYPLDVLRVRLALGSTWTNAIKQGGMFQGLLPTVLGIIPYSGTAWLSKQSMLEYFPTVTKRPPSVLESIIINAVAGLLGQFVSYPLDIVRRRMQIAKINNQTQASLPTLSMVLKQLIETEGWRGAGKGFSLNIIKGPISLSISLTVYDLLRSHFQSMNNTTTNNSNNNIGKKNKNDIR